MKKEKKNRENKVIKNTKKSKNMKFVIEHKYFFEALLILSDELEGKLKKMVEKIEKSSPGSGFSLEQYIKRLKHLHLSEKEPLFSKYFEVRLVDEIRNWKNQRNNILKDMQDVHVSLARRERHVRDGVRLLQEWNHNSKKFKAEFSRLAI